ncbi:molybdopterin-synthase adenylyltransferase MoeB [Shewanella salipaludis]|uniref:Molybdopterin-synthase adenylyltransferase n=1 Tax=Shewanella salipaludis TaxID=2723052 RepID=A0A972JKG7_9GAMM|nr:molybdopterin-synthase adenylyltransferase MoeB [Shewanella salipaludis]NMH66185.1 molybdopterin-synthase adenylyltransferase MoeB [Shewanella salipaludis]
MTGQEILSDAELIRYSRQISLKGMDIDGQEKLKQARVLILGLGGLGCAAGQYLAVAGVGHLTLVDFDTVEASNLQRQVLHGDQDIGRPKVDSARDSLSKLAPHLQLETINARLEQTQLDALVAGHELVLDCSDNMAVREQLNLSCLRQKLPLVSAAAIRMEGLVTVFDFRQRGQAVASPCYHCFASLFGEQQLSCVEAGVLAPVVGMIGCLQAVEAIKLLTHMGRPLTGRVLLLDAMTMEFRELQLPKRPDCRVCGKAASQDE